MLGLLWLKSQIRVSSNSWMVFLGSGGHTGEMIRILEQVQPVNPIFVHGAGDELSKTRVAAIFKDTQFIAVPRARKVGQSWVSTVPTSLQSLARCLQIVAHHNPRFLVVNGPGTCVMVALSVLLCRPLGVKTKIVYIESLARVSSLSLSGKLLYPLADAFVVQWPGLQKKYPRARYLGLVV